MAGPGDAEFWVDKWDVGQIGFHKDFINPWLKDNIQRLTNDRKNLKIFVPLCGKSLDMKWLADLGHSVVGVELVEKAVEEFFQDIDHDVEPLTQCKGKLYKNKDGSIKIYCCDFFDFTSDFEGKFDAIWDRASLVALPFDLTEKYCKSVIALMKENSPYVLESLEYDRAEKKGPPHSIPEETLQGYFGTLNCNMERLNYQESEEDRIKFKLSRFAIRHHLVTFK